MPSKSQPWSAQQPVQLIPDFSYESRSEFLKRLAYRFWVQRGRPLGSPDIDWFAAEQAIYTQLAASGSIDRSVRDRGSIRKEIDRWTEGE